MNEDRFVSLQAVRQVVSRDDVALGVSQHATVQADFEAGEYGEEYLSIWPLLDCTFLTNHTTTYGNRC